MDRESPSRGDTKILLEKVYKKRLPSMCIKEILRI